jgi:hypothetical protein
VKLGGDMLLLGELRRLQIVVVIAVIGAGILPVLVEEEGEQRLGQIVVVLDVAARTGGPVEDGGQRDELLHPVDRADRRLGVEEREVAQEDPQEGQESALLDGQAAIGIGLADIIRSVARDAPCRFGRMQADGCVQRACRLPVAIDLAVMVSDAQMALTYEPPQERVQRKHG